MGLIHKRGVGGVLLVDCFISVALAIGPQNKTRTDDELLDTPKAIVHLSCAL